MRFFLILFTILLCCCSSSTKNETQPENKTPDAEISKRVADENSGNSEEHKPVLDIEDPIKGGPADIKIKIEGLSQGTYKLIGFYAESHFLADSATTNTNGILRFKNSEGYAQGLYYLSVGDKKFMQIVLGEDQKFEMNAKLPNLVTSVEIVGSDENKAFYETSKFESSFNSRYRRITEMLEKETEGSINKNKLLEQKGVLEKERIDYLEKLAKNYPDLLFTKFKKAGQNPTVRLDLPDDIKVYYYRKEFWDNVDFSDSRLIRTPVIFNKLKRYIKELTGQNQDSIFSSSKMLIDKTLNYPEYFKFFSNWVTIQYEPTKCTLMDPEAVFVNMARTYFTKERAFWADSMEVYAIQNRANEMGQSLLGAKGPNVISTDPEGYPKELYKLTADYLIVYMYNPTCEHCMEQTPKLVKWYNENKSKGADVFAIAIDTNEEEWKAYIKKNNMTFTNVFDPTNRSIYAKYYVDITPEIYVLNKERKIIAKNLKVNQIDIMIDRDRGKG